MNEKLRAMVRRWLQLDGPGGLANVLMVKDAKIEAAEKILAEHGALLRQMVPMVNQATIALQRFVVYEQQVPSIKRVFMAMQHRAMREQRKRAAEQALAAPPATPPQDAVLDDVSAEVGGG